MKLCHFGTTPIQEPVIDNHPKFLTPAVARAAVDQALRLVDKESFIGALLLKHNYYIVILVPEICEQSDFTDGRVKALTLHEWGFGDWSEGGFDQIAYSKAQMLWHNLHDSGTDVKPHHLWSGDAPYWGGVKRDNIVVACSGLPAHFDRLLASVIADLCIALAYNNWKEWKAEQDRLGRKPILLD